MSNNTALIELSCSDNQLTSLDLSNNTALIELSCSENQLTSLDLSKNTALIELSCTFNQLTSLDLSNNTALKKLFCYSNQLTSLDLSNNTGLTSLNCTGQEFSIGKVKDSDSYPLSKLPAGFDPSKVLEWKYAKYDADSNSLTDFTNYSVDYEYDLGNGQSEYFKLVRDLSPDLPVFTAEADATSVTLNWNAVENATSYTVKYRLNGKSFWNEKKVSKTSCTISGLTEKTKYDFIVVAVNGKYFYQTNRFTSEYTDNDIITITTKSAPVPAPAKPVFTATAGVESVSLKWNAVEGAKSYRVFYRLNGTSKWTYKNTASTAMTVTGLTGGKVYDFLVRSYDGSAWSSYTASDIKTATPKAVSKPSFTSLTPGVNSVVLRWNAVEGAKSYRVFYRISGTSKWTYKNTTVTAMNLTGLTGGKKYDFLVRSYNGSAWSTYAASDIKTATPKASNKPVIYSAVPGVNSVVLRWNAVSGAKSYRVYYRISGTSKWSYKNTTKNAMNLTGLTGGKTYEFVVRSYNGSTWTAFTSADIVKAAVKTNV